MPAPLWLLPSYSTREPHLHARPCAHIAPAGGNCSTAAPEPIDCNRKPAFKHSSVTCRKRLSLKIRDRNVANLRRAQLSDVVKAPARASRCEFSAAERFFPAAAASAAGSCTAARTRNIRRHRHVSQNLFGNSLKDGSRDVPAVMRADRLVDHHDHGNDRIRCRCEAGKRSDNFCLRVVPVSSIFCAVPVLPAAV